MSGEIIEQLVLLAFIITTNDETTTLRLIYKNRHFAV